MKRLLLTITLLLPLGAFAASPPAKSAPFAGLLAAPDQLAKAAAQLGLSARQIGELRQIHEANFSTYRDRTGAVGRAQEALRSALEKQPIDETEAGARFAALLDAERAVKDIEFRTLVAARRVLTNEQFAKMRALQHEAAGSSSTSASPSSSPTSREDAVKAKLQRLEKLVKARENAGDPPREHESALRELERAVREKNVEQAEQRVDELLRALDPAPAGAATGPDAETRHRLHSALSAAQRAKDATTIASLVAEMRAVAGAALGEPEHPVKLEHPPKDATALTPATLPTAFAPMLERIERTKFWRIGLDPAQLSQFPRVAGSVVIGALAARRAGCAEPERLLATAREAGDFLVWAQAEAGTGLFPFPARRNGEGKVWQIAERAFRAAEKQGRYDEIVHRGWAVEDLGVGDDGGLQIENAVCAIGVLHLYEATGEEKYLRSARAAGDWALGRPCVPNWNYNSFSVWLLAELHRVTGDARYLDSAREKTRLGVLPGQLTEGPRAGRWLDPHNALPNYHYILTRSLACLLPRLAEDDPDRALVLAALRRALLAWNPTFPRDGLPNIASASEALALLELRLPDHEKLLGDTGVRPALLALERLGSAATAAGQIAGDPSSWGLVIEAAARRNPPKPASR